MNVEKAEIKLETKLVGRMKGKFLFHRFNAVIDGVNMK